MCNAICYDLFMIVLQCIRKEHIMNLGSAIDALWAKREKKREMEAKLKEVEAEIADSEALVMELMEMVIENILELK